MKIGKKMARDTALLTLMQLGLDTAALLLSSFIARRLGASATGILSLIGSFLGLAGILSSGNAFLCTSRLISEEIGRRNGCPERVLRHGICLCLCLSTAVSLALELLAPAISRTFFSGAGMTFAVKIMPAALVTGAVSACLKGYFNAVRKAGIAALGDVAEFLLRAGMIVSMSLGSTSHTESSVCRILIFAVIVGNAGSLIFLGTAYLLRERPPHGRGELSFSGYARLAFPIMGGGVLTAVLSSTNDALVPVCLRQYGDSVEEALGLFGIFEAIVIPTLFFPSVVLCSVSGIVVSESARASGAGNKRRILSLTDRLLTVTLAYAIMAAAVLMRFGGFIGQLLGGGETAGRMIALIAPVVPFIYMEIILEALIKGMGEQGFSSLNYLAEYVIRISVVLILVPRIGFWGIAASYYTSNVFGNIMRLRKVLRTSGAGLHIIRRALLPAVYAFLIMGSLEPAFGIMGLDDRSLPGAVIFIVLWVLGYGAAFCCLDKIKTDSRPIRGLVVQDDQISI
ncbi:MAG: polysaccharide biosynthesis C-terminal domain-containing protein [Ruminococcus sp.]|nr:polysaccharide biosynthesis C-terminal domain-containing protein [Ruminococcus sp.]